MKRSKWFSLKFRFRGDICEISDSAPVNTARSHAVNDVFENPKVANTARSRTPRRLTLRGVSLALVLSLHPLLAFIENNKF